jgi:hypothetical protein
MIEPFSIGALGAIALTDGIKFLYAQAGEILKRRRERQATADPAPAAELLEGELAPLQLDPAAADELTEELRRLRRQLADIADGIEPARATDVAATLALREAIESIVGQRITFRGERREPTGTPTITGTVRATDLRGRVSGVDLEGTPTGTIHGEVIADTAGEDADVAGVRIR